MSQIIDKAAVAVTFYYREDRLSYLSEAVASIPEFASDFRIWVITNQSGEFFSARIQGAIDLPNVTIVTPTLLGHPFLLTWSHRPIFEDLVSNDSTFSHFLYMEDDIKITQQNVRYWHEANEALQVHGFIPGFIRYEELSDGTKVATDIRNVHRYFEMARLSNDRYAYLNFKNPYQGFYLMTRKQMEGFLASKSSNPEFGPWPIREKATQGLVWEQVPRGCISNAFVGFRRGEGIDPRALVHHLPNNYARSKSKQGTLPITHLVTEHHGYGLTFIKRASRALKFQNPFRSKPLKLEIPS